MGGTFGLFGIDRDGGICFGGRWMPFERLEVVRKPNACPPHCAARGREEYALTVHVSIAVALELVVMVRLLLSAFRCFCRWQSALTERIRLEAFDIASLWRRDRDTPYSRDVLGFHA